MKRRSKDEWKKRWPGVTWEQVGTRQGPERLDRVHAEGLIEVCEVEGSGCMDQCVFSGALSARVGIGWKCSHD